MDGALFDVRAVGLADPQPHDGQARSSSAAQAAAGAPWKASPSSPSSSPTCPPPPNGASANSTPSAGCSPARHGSRPHSNQPDNPAKITSSSRHLVNSYVQAGTS